MLALLIKNKETCSYRYLIYDMLGFKEENYAELISGMEITNKLVECEIQKEALDKIKEYCNNRLQYYNEMERDYGKIEFSYAENENDFESKFEEYKLKINSYMTKEEFISMINNLDFKIVKSCDLKLITDIIINCKDMTFKEFCKKVSIK